MRPDLAPNHVAHIKKLAREGFYDGIVFHRVIDGFMAQTGDPTGTGTGGSKYPNLEAGIQRRAARARRLPRWPARRARTAPTRSSSSCFDDARFLDRQYTVWGKVIEGMDNVDKIKRGEPVQQPRQDGHRSRSPPTSPHDPAGRNRAVLCGARRLRPLATEWVNCARSRRRGELRLSSPARSDVLVRSPASTISAGDKVWASDVGLRPGRAGAASARRSRTHDTILHRCRGRRHGDQDRRTAPVQGQRGRQLRSMRGTLRIPRAWAPGRVTCTGP